MKKHVTMFLVGFLVFSVFVGYSNDLSAASKKPDNFPTKPISIIIPAAAGAAIDIPTRVMNENLNFGVPVVLENRAGASQTIGTTEAFTRPADGYSLVVGANGNFMIQPHLVDLTYKTENFRHISMLTSPDATIVVVNSKSPYKSWNALAAKIKAGEELTFSAGNPGGVEHLAGIKLWKEIGAPKMKFVPFNGSAAAFTALLGGHIDVLIIVSSEVVPKMADGTVIPLMTLDVKRVEGLPNVPSAKEMGLKVDFDRGYKWIAIKKGTPEPIVQWMKQQIDTAIKSEKYQSFLMKQTGRGVDPGSEKDLTELVMSFLKSNGELLKEIGMKK